MIAARFHAFLNAIGRPSEADEVRRLRSAVAARLTDLEIAGADAAHAVADTIAEPPLSDYLATLLTLIFDDEGYFGLPPDDGRYSVAELWALQETLRTQLRLLNEIDGTLGYVSAFAHAALPALGITDQPSPFRAPLYAQIREFPEYLERLLCAVLAEDLERFGLFRRLRERLLANLAEVDKNQVRLPTRHTSNDPRVLMDAYLRGTPLPAFLNQTIALPVPDETLFAHMHVVGGSGAGKTQFLQNLILHHLDRDDPPALVVIDSQGELIPKLARLSRFDPEGGDLADRLIVISPRDVDYPPAINIFDVRNERLERYDAATREQVVAGVIQTFDYLFTGLLGADLTAKQSVFFRYIARLMLTLPQTLGRNATILDMLRLMEDAAPYAAAIQALPPIQRSFFEKDFSAKTFTQTREQIRYRLHAIIENPTLARLFTSASTKIDLFAELNRGSVILVDTAKDFLKGSSAHFGQIFISLVLQAVLERAALPEGQRRPAFLFVDEAAEYFDSNIDDLLTETRKHKLGCIFAHQYLDQATSALRASFAANTNIKFAAGVSMSDARALAADMRTTPDFIMSQPRLHFAAHIRNVTPNAVSVPVFPGMLDRQPMRSAEHYENFLARNRERVSQSAAPLPANPPDEMTEEY